jgi:AcrR family transcriptional regulator
MVPISGATVIVQVKYEQRSQRSSTLARRTSLAERLVDLAEAMIGSSGLDDLRARALADAAGCSVGAIYTVFPDLDELVLSVNTRTLDAIDAVMTKAAQDVPAPAVQMSRLASAYLDYAIAHRGCWNALFQHRMAGGRPLPEWYAMRLEAAFTHIETPLGMLQPKLERVERSRLAHTVFSAVHGVVQLGLDSKLTNLASATQHDQLQILVTALARGLGEPANTRETG